MRIKNHLFWLCFTGLILLAVLVIFLPRYISRSLDLRAMNHVEISKRDDFSFLEQGSNDTAEAARAFLSLGQEEGNPVLITSIEEPIQMSSELLETLQIQAETAAELGMLPRLMGYVDVAVEKTDDYAQKTGEEEDFLYWVDCMQFARYYSLTYESKENPNKKELLNFWYLNFSDGERFDYYFVINAVTSEIYYAEIHNAFTQYEIGTEKEIWQGGKATQEYERYTAEMAQQFSYACALYYQAQGFDAVGSQNLYQKLSLAILYFEDGQPVYIERSIAEGESDYMYQGICMGLQNLVNWIRVLREKEA